MQKCKISIYIFFFFLFNSDLSFILVGGTLVVIEFLIVDLNFFFFLVMFYFALVIIIYCFSNDMPVRNVKNSYFILIIVFTQYFFFVPCDWIIAATVVMSFTCKLKTILLYRNRHICRTNDNYSVTTCKNSIQCNITLCMNV